MNIPPILAPGQRTASRCLEPSPTPSHGFWLSALFAIVALAVLLFMPTSHAGPIVVDDSYNFQTGPQGWTATPVGKNGQLPPATGGMRWGHTGTQWSVNWAPVAGPLAATGNYLTSPTINPFDQIGGPIDAFRISLAHKFNFSSSLNGVPPAAGQLAYSINGGPFIGIDADDFSTGLVTTPDSVFGASPLIGPPSLVGQTTLVAPTFVPPVSPYPDLFPLINGGASFTGVTPGYSNTGGTWVPSVAIVTFDSTLVTDFRLRLINANLGSNCPADAGWDVRFAQVDFAAPEPSSVALAGIGVAGLAAGYVRRRCFNTAPRGRA